MYFAGPPIWLLLAPLYLLIVVVVLVIAVVVKLRSRKRPKDLPSCRRCGYAVVGLERGVCPECGSHLTDVHAIVRPDTTGVGTAIKRLVLFALLASYPALVAGLVLAELSIWPNLCGSSIQAIMSHPTSQAYDAVQIHVATDDIINAHRDNVATFQIDWSPKSPGETLQSRTWQVDLHTMRWRQSHPRIPLPPDWSERPLDADALATHIADRGFTGNRPALVAEAQCILDNIAAMRDLSMNEPLPASFVNGPTSTVPFGQATYGNPMMYCENPWWVPWVIAAFELLLWLIVAVFIIFGARRQALRHRLALQQAIASTNSQGLPS